ncbi:MULTISPECIES: bifunctional tetrahydrofolate synthase/dihydrofolate synthase [Acinetobacter]|uniref:bifunctional tetrahydrofolate synthase/dihydrofolate synthase n=1 Tax=Acinetobacter TaxID=469 RepID=UPI00019AE6C9|nr:MULTISPECIES: bifunctional tetrahydrofolate synthase/dihydrofolate synthase [Acinetobacter]EEH67241.1 bifunctional protein FolC [Acinetobacter sp. ATCC 27244]NAR50874.1 bifunctional tetrahydrofolate synthase/dihydrofolate synthase [Acinetobacter haemolyticus]NAR53702.1 bifunctional tetrahydrofolate synthase/dihydrofolate synthase [Acinetobacter haemolyticus]NAR56283.1 bifunctional tetrahydrofolate synthase/dihydrofolate synthase [Acinetobacter haemolyticus]NAR60214.1 bifunctional tetrahydro
MKPHAPRSTDTLTTWLDYWSHVHVTGIDLGLERVIPVAEKLGVMRPNAKVFTVAGTNGKGSTTTTLAAILNAQGYKVGLYQSPHIYRFNERVKLAGIEVDDQSLVDAFVAVDQARRDCGLSLSFFEATTLAAFVIFKHQQCNVWVLEVGLGGRLDVVNVIDPDIAVITNIGLDHTDWLGDTIEKIAFEKAGIIRPDIPVVFAGQQQLPQAIQDKVAETQARLYALNRDYFYQLNDDGQSWSFASSGTTLKLPVGQLALENISTAVAAVLASGLKISQQAIATGIQQARLQGRFEIRQIQDKTVIFDAGHNAHGVEFLLKQLRNFLKYNKQYTEVVAVFSMLADKDIASVTNLLKTTVKDWFIATLDVPRAAPMHQLHDALQEQQVLEFGSIQDAFETALKQCNNNQLILVCGSFHTLEAVWEYLEQCQ